MSRDPGEVPQFARLICDLQRAEFLWWNGDCVKASAILKMVGSIALSECEERGEHAPVPESVL